MLTFEEIFDKITMDKRWVQKALIGGLIMFVPIVNIFAFGYLYRIARNTFETRTIQLPEWEKWGDMFREGLRFLAAFICYGLVPVFLGWVLSVLLGLVTLDLLGWIDYIPLSLSILIAPSLFAAALCPLLKDSNDFKSLLNCLGYFKQCLAHWKKLIVPTLVLLGVLIVGSPLYGFSIFLGFSVMVPYFVLVFTKTKTKKGE